MFDKAMNSTLCQDVVAQLCKMILDGKIKKGDMLPSEAKLCQLFGVSRTTIRSALAVLAQRNIIVTHRGKGSTVVDDKFPKPGDVLRLKNKEKTSRLTYALQTCIIFEPRLAFEAACRADDLDIQALTEAHELCMRKCGEDKLSFDDIKLFHMRVGGIFKNPVITDTLDNILSLCAPDTGKIQLAYEMLDEQHKLLTAICERHPEDAYIHMREVLRCMEEG